MSTSRRADRRATGEWPAIRWECACKQPPVLLGTYDQRGLVNLKVRDRYFYVFGLVRTSCPRCGMQHLLDLRSICEEPRAALSAGDL
jgi:hypothetical protein